MRNYILKEREIFFEMNYEKFIYLSIKKNYSNSDRFNSNIIKSYRILRKKLLEKYKKKISLRTEKQFLNKDFIKKYLLNLYLYKKKLDVYNEKKFLKYYRFFNVFLKLRNNNKKKTNILSYMYLAVILIRYKKINYLQKLNTILKILDILYFVNSDEITLLDYKILNKIIDYEEKCIKKLLN